MKRGEQGTRGCQFAPAIVEVEDGYVWRIWIVSIPQRVSIQAVS